jgi:hypothetical protein
MSNQQTVVVRLGQDSPQLVELDTEILWRRLDDRDGPWSSCTGMSRYQPTNALVDRLASEPVAGRTIDEVLRHDGVALWPFVVSYIWPDLFRAQELRALLVRLVVDTAASDLVAIVGDGPSAATWYAVAKSVAVERGLGLEVRAEERAAPARRSAVDRLRGSRLEPAVRRGRSAVAWSVARRARPPAEGRRVLYATIARHAQPAPFTPGGWWDEQLSPVLPELEARGWSALAVDCPYGPRFQARRAADVRAEAMPTTSWSGFERWERPWARRRRFSLDELLAGVPDGQDRALWPALVPALRRAATTASECAAQLDAAGRLLDECRPEVVLSSYETGPFQRAIQVQAARRRIPTVGLQHGMIFENHYDYVHDRVVAGGDGSVGFSAPDVTCVWGPMWREVLCEHSSYPEASVIVTGSWRHEPVLRRPPDHEGTRRLLGVLSDGPIALLLPGGTDPLGFLAATLAPARSLGLVPLVKLHPREDHAPYRAWIDRAELPPWSLVDGRLAEALTVARVAVSTVSTAVAEAMLFRVPVVLFDDLRHAGAQRYVDEGSCLHCSF